MIFSRTRQLTGDRHCNKCCSSRDVSVPCGWIQVKGA